MRTPVILFGLIFSIIGCRPPAMNYRLRREGRSVLLFPPAEGAISQDGAVEVTITHARRNVPSTIDCNIDRKFVSLHWQGRAARVSALREPYFADLPGQTLVPARQGIQLDPLVGVEDFQNSLLNLQEKGCLSCDENKQLRRRIIESVPMPPELAYFFQLGSFDVTGFFDLTSDFRLEVVSPIYAPGADRTPENLKGYETARYTFRGTRKSDRIRMSLTSAKETLLGEAPVEKQFARNDLGLPNSLGYYRLLFMRDQTSSNSITRAVLLSAADQTSLTQASRPHQMEAESFCTTLGIPGVSCTVFPRTYGVNPELRVRVNGSETFLSRWRNAL
jgi:hypothetical protein